MAIRCERKTPPLSPLAARSKQDCRLLKHFVSRPSEQARFDWTEATIIGPKLPFTVGMGGALLQNSEG